MGADNRLQVGATCTGAMAARSEPVPGRLEEVRLSATERPAGTAYSARGAAVAVPAYRADTAEVAGSAVVVAAVAMAVTRRAPGEAVAALFPALEAVATVAAAVTTKTKVAAVAAAAG